MSDEHHSGLLYGLEQRIPPLPAFFSALQHVLAGLVGDHHAAADYRRYPRAWRLAAVSHQYVAAGLGHRHFSAVQSGMGHRRRDDLHAGHQFCLPRRDGGRRDVGKAQGGGPQDMMAMLFGVNFVAALVPVIVSRFIEPLKKIFTPIITGSVIALIGISLIKVSVINWCGGEKAEDFASMSNIALGAGTLGVIVLLSCAKNRWLRLSSVVVGIAVGCIAAGLSGQFHLHSLGDTLFRLPTLFPVRLSV